MGQALYRKYRSKSLNDVVGQDHITRTLEQALKQGRISHAYLFTGPRGVGKTSVARILAHEINGLPYTDDSSHLDIIEIDAASNRRIDEIRELRDKVYVAPTSAKYKVYIIDEVHMLTREAFNALLKTLEEPPAHVVFILATTDAHKLPETIISRTQRFSFKPAEAAAIVDLLKTVAKTEGIKAADDALQLIAEHADGSFRDSLGLLDQASSHGEPVELATVQQLLGIPPEAALQQLFDQLARHATPAEVMTQLNQLYDQGYQAATIAKQLGQLLRRALVAGQTPLPGQQLLMLLGNLLKVPAAHDPARYLEICLLQAVSHDRPVIASQSSAPAANDTVPVIALPEPPERPAAVDKPPKPVKTAPVALDETVWPQVLQTLKQRHNTLYGIVRMARPRLAEDNLELVFAFAFHQKRMSEADNQRRLREIIHELTGRTVSVTAITDSSLESATQDSEPTQSPDLAAISNIFGGGELLES